MNPGVTLHIMLLDFSISPKDKQNKKEKKKNKHLILIISLNCLTFVHSEYIIIEKRSILLLWTKRETLNMKITAK